MNELEDAELALRRAKDKYDELFKAKQQEEQAQQQPAQPAQPPEGSVMLDFDKITSIEDIVAIMKTTGFKIWTNPSMPTYSLVEHLTVDEEDAPEAENTSQ